MKRFRSVTLVSVCAAMVLSACGGGKEETRTPVSDDWNEVVAAAEAEGEVVLYATVVPENLEKLKKSFEKAYPKIKLTYVRGTEADILPKVELEQKTGKAVADVHISTDSAFIHGSLESDMSAEVRGPSFDAEAYDRSASVIDDKWFLTSASVFGYAWNTEKVPEALDSPEAVLSSKFVDGKIGVLTPVGSAAYVDMYRWIDAKFGDNYVERLAELRPRVYDSGGSVTQALVSGEVWLTPSVGTTVLAEKNNGAPVEFAVPENPWGVPWYSRVLSAAPHPNAAQVLADFLVTNEGQEAVSANFIATLPDVKGTGVPGVEVLAQDIPLSDPEDLTSESVAKYAQEWESSFLR